jgi:hypothetical protein
MRCRSGKARWRTKSETPVPASAAAPHRRLAQVEQLDPLLLPPLSLARARKDSD